MDFFHRDDRRGGGPKTLWFTNLGGRPLCHAPGGGTQRAKNAAPGAPTRDKRKRAR
jgi:hypothetical protein